jgi:hypothetical protein
MVSPGPSRNAECNLAPKTFEIFHKPSSRMQVVNAKCRSFDSLHPPGRISVAQDDNMVIQDDNMVIQDDSIVIHNDSIV